MLKMPRFHTTKLLFSNSAKTFENYDSFIDGFTADDRTPFCYLIEHIPSGLKYYGVRYAKNCSPHDMGKKYSSSSKPMWALLNTSTIDDIRFEIRKVFPSVDAACDWEGKVNRRLTVKSDNYLNIRADVKGNKKKSIKTKTIAICNDNENIELRVPVNIDINLFVGYRLGRLKAPITAGTKRRVYHAETRHEFLIGLNDEIPDGYQLGSMYRSIKNVITQKTKPHNINDEIPEGWVFAQAGRDCNAGTTFIVNDGINLKSIKIGSEIPEGWVKGIIVSGNKGTTSYYNPLTDDILYIRNDSEIPDGYLKGNPNMLGKPSKHKGMVTSYNPVTDKLQRTYPDNVPIGNLLDIPKHKNKGAEKGAKWYHSHDVEMMLYPHQPVPDKFVPGRLTKAIKHQMCAISD